MRPSRAGKYSAPPETNSESQEKKLIVVAAKKDNCVAPMIALGLQRYIEKRGAYSDASLDRRLDVSITSVGTEVRLKESLDGYDTPGAWTVAQLTVDEGKINCMSPLTMRKISFGEALANDMRFRFLGQLINTEGIAFGDVADFRNFVIADFAQYQKIFNENAIRDEAQIDETFKDVMLKHRVAYAFPDASKWEKSGGGAPAILYRGDSRGPQTIFGSGFAIQDDDFEGHYFDLDPSKECAKYFAGFSADNMASGRPLLRPGAIDVIPTSAISAVAADTWMETDGLTRRESHRKALTVAAYFPQISVDSEPRSRQSDSFVYVVAVDAYWKTYLIQNAFLNDAIDTGPGIDRESAKIFFGAKEIAVGEKIAPNHICGVLKISRETTKNRAKSGHSAKINAVMKNNLKNGDFSDDVKATCEQRMTLVAKDCLFGFDEESYNAGEWIECNRGKSFETWIGAKSNMRAGPVKESKDQVYFEEDAADDSPCDVVMRYLKNPGDTKHVPIDIKEDDSPFEKTVDGVIMLDSDVLKSDIFTSSQTPYQHLKWTAEGRVGICEGTFPDPRSLEGFVGAFGGVLNPAEIEAEGHLAHSMVRDSMLLCPSGNYLGGVAIRGLEDLLTKKLHLYLGTEVPTNVYSPWYSTRLGGATRNGATRDGANSKVCAVPPDLKGRCIIETDLQSGNPTSTFMGGLLPEYCPDDGVVGAEYQVSVR
eukprot:g1368.t1